MEPAAICCEVRICVVLRVGHEIRVYRCMECPGVGIGIWCGSGWIGGRGLAGPLGGEQNQHCCHTGECAPPHYPPRRMATPTSSSPMATIAKPAISRLVLV